MRALIRVSGAVQGIGYRPFVAELATKYELKGEVKNLGGIVEIIVDGDEKSICSFKDQLWTSSPSGSIIVNISLEYLNETEPECLKDSSGFRIVESSDDEDNTYIPVFPPDIGICDKCLYELQDKNDRRYGYPLISCASCGPRFSILQKLPYDRETTTMGVFSMCPECAKEYKMGRRRHAQTISCHNCGPQLKFLGPDNLNIEGNEDAISTAVKLISNGGIIGLKGIGGYQLLADPYNYDAVSKLREIKGRERKPFAVMFDSISDITAKCEVSKLEEKYLCSSARPIVLLDKKAKKILKAKYHLPEELDLSAEETEFSENICGESRQIGAFLPSSGIHKMITVQLKAIIATSGNISGEPMIISDDIFREKFLDKIDGILYYDREILKPLDDSVLQIIRLCDNTEVPRFIRRARGYVPTPVFLKNRLKCRNLYHSFGADLKNTFSIGYGDRIVMSQFLGDMENYGILKLQQKEVEEFDAIFRTDKLDIKDEIIVSDMHPGYHSSKLADLYAKNRMTCISDMHARNGQTSIQDENVRIECIQIQHHHAHIGSVMAENGLTECIGVAFDGTGFGEDKTIWGSEFMLCRSGEFVREGYLKPVHLVGQDEGMKNAAIAAACYLVEYDKEIPSDIMEPGKSNLIRAAISNNINSYPNSGMGRFFDAISCILKVCKYNSYEGECAIRLQNLAEEYIEDVINCSDIEDKNRIDVFKNMSHLPKTPLIDINDITGEMDVSELLEFFLNSRNSGDAGKLAYIFHYSIVDAVRKRCIRLREKYGISTVCLSGGVFANRLLLTMCEKFLSDLDFVVYYNSILPTNDGGISAGQIYLADLRQY